MANKDQTIDIEQQNIEITKVKEKYGPQCKVIHDVGEFTNVVIIRPEAVDIVIKFQLTASYPREKPAVIVRSESIAVDSMPEIMDLVNKTTIDNDKAPVIEIVAEKILHHLRELGLDTPPEVIAPTKKKGKSGKSKKKEKKKEQAKDETSVDMKKPSMKTAEDVIKRIMWDESLPTDSFHVGYLDRFKGIMEKAFTAFSWEDLASVDYDVLAIPKHRIQFFKYKDVIIWDKNKRIDYVFGSVGKGVSIHDIMDNYDLYHSVQQEHAVKKDEPQSKQILQEEFDSDDEDDGIEVDFGCSGNVGKEHVQDEDRRPNHFFCVRITDEEIIEGIEVVQDAILENEPRYASCCIRPSTLHLTLCTVGLDTDDQRMKAARVLSECSQELCELAKDNIELRLEGVNNFYDRVIYARVHHDMAFRDFVDRFRSILEQNGVEIRDNYGYVPHVTIMKTTRPVSRELSTPKVNPDLYNHFSDMYFGKQSVEGIYLCEMNDQRRPDGFYVTHANISVHD